MRLKNKTILITGGTAGIGKASVEACLREGATVFFTGRNIDKINVLEKLWGKKSIGIQSDASQLEQQIKLADNLKQRAIKFDAIFFNAGDVTHAPLHDWNNELYDQVFNTNVKAPFFLLQQIIPLLNYNSSIIFCGSTSIHIGLAQSSVYAASKAALRSLVKTLSSEFLEQKFRFNLLSPGPTQTEAFDKLGLVDDQKEVMIESIKNLVPLKRFGKPQELAAALVFLASDESKFMLGTEILVDGGVANL